MRNRSIPIWSVLLAGLIYMPLPAAAPAWWMAQWRAPVKANYIVLSGVYPNQPQPKTAWKIELWQHGVWKVHARGIGGW